MVHATDSLLSDQREKSAAWSFVDQEFGKSKVVPPPAQGDEALLEGTVRNFSFRNEKSEFGVLRAEVPIAPGSPVLSTVTIVGTVPGHIRTGSTFVARGKWQEHPKFGKQFRAFSVVEKTPTGVAELVRYLSSGAIKGIGPALAERIVAAFGNDTLRVLDEEPALLLEVEGIGRKKLEEITSIWDESKKERELILFLQRLGLGAGGASRIRTKYGLRAVEIISKDPYVLVEDVWGIGFLRADEIAQTLGIEKDSTQRIRAGIAHELKRGSEDGHCFLPIQTLFQRTQKLLDVDDFDRMQLVCEQMVSEQLLFIESERCYTPALRDAEKVCGRQIAEFLEASRTGGSALSKEVVEQAKNGAQTISETDSNTLRTIRLSEEQQRAIDLAATQRLLVITGGPGCGKTTVLRTIVQMFREAGLTFRLAAPTGKASQRLAEVCGNEASTIHRLLKFDPQTRDFVHNSENPLELDALVVDEMSMVDLPLAASLFDAMPNGARLVLVGDADQLPSVGPGLVLADLLSIPEVPQVRLTNLFRRSEQSLISFIAHQVNSGEVPEIPEPDGVTKSDAYFLSARTSTDAASLIEKLVVDQIPKKFGFSGAQIAVLSPMNQGDLGVISLNQRLQSRVLPLSETAPSVQVGNLAFRIGDRVCQRVNNYNAIEGGVFNGEQGEVVGIDAEAQRLFVRFWDGREVEYSSDILPQLDLAYALSIHRSQGSESPVVVLALHEAHSILLERQLIYTGITRAKKLLIVVGTKRALVYAVKRTPSKRRFTNLVGAVRQSLEKAWAEKDTQVDSATEL